MAPAPAGLGRREVLATAGVGLSGLAGCNFGPVGETAPDRPPLWGESVRVGVLAPAGLPQGVAIERGARMASERINADGGVAGAGVELVVADTDADPAVACEAHRRLCEAEDCDLTVGLFLSSTVRETLESVAEQETVHLTTGALDGRAGARVAEGYGAYRYHFRPGLPNYRDLADALVAFLAEAAGGLGWERAALLTENLDEFGAYRERLEGRLEAVVDVPVAAEPAGLGDWAPLYDEVEAADCDVALVGMALGGDAAVQQWARGERDFEFGGLHLPAMAPDYWARTGGDVEGVFTLAGLTRGADNTGRTRGFVDDYAVRYGSPPPYSAATTYDALALYRRAVESAVGPDDAALPDQGTVVDSLEGTTFTGGVLYREFEFTGPDADLAHEPVWESMAATGVPVVQQWQADGDGKGRPAAVAPERVRTAPYRRRPWLAAETSR